MSQKATILQWLQEERAVCATTLLANRIPRGAARISELRGEGHRIVTEECDSGVHGHRTRQIQYRLVTSGTPF